MDSAGGSGGRSDPVREGTAQAGARCLLHIHAGPRVFHVMQYRRPEQYAPGGLHIAKRTAMMTVLLFV